MTSAVSLFHEKAPGQDRLVFLGPDYELLEIWFDALHRPNLMGSVHQARIDRVFSSQNRAMASLKNGEVISLRLRKNDRHVVIVGAVLPVTIVAAPRHGKPWQALVGARLVAMLFKGWPHGLFAILVVAIQTLLVSVFMMLRRCLMPQAGIRRAIMWKRRKKFTPYHDPKEDHDQCGEAIS